MGELTVVLLAVTVAAIFLGRRIRAGVRRILGGPADGCGTGPAGGCHGCGSDHSRKSAALVSAGERRTDRP